MLLNHLIPFFSKLTNSSIFKILKDLDRNYALASFGLGPIQIAFECHEIHLKNFFCSIKFSFFTLHLQ